MDFQVNRVNGYIIPSFFFFFPQMKAKVLIQWNSGLKLIYQFHLHLHALQLLGKYLDLHCGMWLSNYVNILISSIKVIQDKSLFWFVFSVLICHFTQSSHNWHALSITQMRGGWR